MITNFKIFENNKDIEVGDYVLFDDLNVDIKIPTDNFIKKNIGEVVLVQGEIITVSYKNLPVDLIPYFNSYKNYKYVKNIHKDFLISAKNKETLLKKMKAKKYNIL